MDIRIAARALGGDVAGPGRVLCPGPGHSPRDRSLSVRFDAGAPDGFLVDSFAGDDWQECKDHVRALLGIPYEGRSECELRHRDDDVGRGKSFTHEESFSHVERPSRTRDYALSLWQESCPIVSTPAETYLTRRNIALANEALEGHALRFHARCPFRLESGETARLPAMMALMRDVQTDEPTGVHRTALAPDGSGKAAVRGLDSPKKMLGSARNAAVKLSPDDDVCLGLHVAEGIETALAVMAMGFRPIWACLSAGGIARFPVLGGIDAITVFADRDASGTGDRAARECAERWHEADREARIIAPPVIGDFADEVAA